MCLYLQLRHQLRHRHAVHLSCLSVAQSAAAWLVQQWLPRMHAGLPAPLCLVLAAPYRIAAVGNGWIELERTLPYGVPLLCLLCTHLQSAKGEAARPTWMCHAAVVTWVQQPVPLTSPAFCKACGRLQETQCQSSIHGIPRFPADVRTKWEPVLHKFAPTVQNSGLRGFTVEFKWSECRCFVCLRTCASQAPVCSTSLVEHMCGRGWAAPGALKP